MAGRHIRYTRDTRATHAIRTRGALLSGLGTALDDGRRTVADADCAAPPCPVVCEARVVRNADAAADAVDRTAVPRVIGRRVVVKDRAADVDVSALVVDRTAIARVARVEARADHVQHRRVVYDAAAVGRRVAALEVEVEQRQDPLVPEDATSAAARDGDGAAAVHRSDTGNGKRLTRGDVEPAGGRRAGGDGEIVSDLDLRSIDPSGRELGDCRD